MRSNPHAQHAAQGMPEENCRRGNALAQKAGDVFSILRATVSASHAGRFAMTAKVRREDMPAHAQRRNHRKKYLPAPPQSMQQHKRRPMSRPFGIVQLNAQANFAAIKGVLDQAWMIFAHNVFAHNIPRLDSSARGASVVS